MKYLYIWRFQPFHLGHLDAIQQAYATGAEHIIIAIGSPDLIDEDNPRDLEMRMQMVCWSLAEADISEDCYTLTSIPDNPSDLQWVEYIMKKFPAIEVVMSWNSWVEDIFVNQGIPIFNPETNTKIDIHATQIREWKRSGDDKKTQKYLSDYVFSMIS